MSDTPDPYGRESRPGELRRAIDRATEHRMRRVEVTRFEVLQRQAIGDASEALAACGVTRTELARRMGRDVSSVQEWFVGGRKNLPMAVLYALTAPEAEVFLAHYARSAGLMNMPAKSA